MAEQQNSRPTPLHDQHLKQNARMIDYAGWHMPVQYTGIAAEHLAARQSAALFDVSHMGEILVSGSAATAFINYLLTRNLNTLTPGRAYYSPMCDESGGTIDDLIVYPLAADRLLLVVNAANTEKDFGHILREAGKWPVQVENVSDSFAQLSLQGPAAAEMLPKLGLMPEWPAWPEVLALGNYRYIWRPDPDLQNSGYLLSRTGYTGEDGFEFYLPPAKAADLWDRLLELGAVPAGLGARDSLRMEAGMPLYGHELGPAISPIEAGLQRFVDLGKPAPGFIGQAALQHPSRPIRRLIGLKSAGRAIPRADYPVLLNGHQIGQVTSGGFSPSLNQGLAMALVKSDSRLDTGSLSVLIREREEPFTLCPLPFYHR